MTHIQIYSRPGCHLCDEMKAVVGRLALSMPLVIEDIDISTDPGLEGLYGQQIPVLIIDGKKAAKYRVTEETLRRILRGRAGGAGEADG
jgi:glutaredoxin